LVRAAFLIHFHIVPDKYGFVAKGCKVVPNEQSMKSILGNRSPFTKEPFVREPREGVRKRELSVGRRWASSRRARVHGALTIQPDYWHAPQACQELSADLQSNPAIK
jgi:hypothetical protein